MHTSSNGAHTSSFWCAHICPHNWWAFNRREGKMLHLVILRHSEICYLLWKPFTLTVNINCTTHLSIQWSGAIGEEVTGLTHKHTPENATNKVGEVGSSIPLHSQLPAPFRVHSHVRRERKRRSAHILALKQITGPLEPVWGLNEADCPSLNTCPLKSKEVVII